MYRVYKHTFPNNKIYIGITSINPLKRWKNGEGYRTQLVYRAIKKYGWDNIQHEIICEGLSKKEAEQKEIELIAEYKSTNLEFGYNISLGGSIVEITNEIRQKMSKAHLGVPLSESHKEGLKRGRAKRLVQPNTGKHLSENWKDAVAKSVSKSVNQFDINGNFIASYFGQKEASKITGISCSNIMRCCKGERKTAGGYIWRYADDCQNKWVS